MTLPRRSCALRQHSPGQALAELAIIAPVLLLLMLVAVDFGRLFYTYIQLNNAAREGAAYAAGAVADPSLQTDVAIRVRQEANVQGQGGENVGMITVVITCLDTGGGSIACNSAQGASGIGNRVDVAVSEPFSFLTPIISGAFGGNLPLSVNSTASINNPAPCTVPAFVGKLGSQGATLWTNAGFAAGNLTSTVASSATIASQSRAAGTKASCAAAKISLK